MTRTATAAAATVIVQIPVPLLHPRLVQARTTLTVCQTENGHVWNLSVQLSAERDGVLCQGTLRTAIDLHKHGAVSQVGDEGSSVWVGGLWFDTRRTVTVTGGAPATVTGMGAGAIMQHVLRVKKIKESSMIPGPLGLQTKCGTVRQVRTVTQVCDAQHGGAGLTMQRIAMQVQMKPLCWLVSVAGGGSGKWRLEHELPCYALRLDQVMACFIWYQSRKRSWGWIIPSSHEVSAVRLMAVILRANYVVETSHQRGCWWYLVVISCFYIIFASKLLFIFPSSEASTYLTWNHCRNVP